MVTSPKPPDSHYSIQDHADLIYKFILDHDLKNLTLVGNSFGGALIAPDENSGQMWAIDPSGNASLIAVPNLPTGGDTGVESLGFVPPGFSTGGAAYLADRATPNNPFPGTDSLLRLSSAALVSAGVEDGDLLVSTEGGGTTVAIRCAATCSVSQVALGTPGGHIEGHVTVVADQPISP